MKLNWFKRHGWFYLPTTIPGVAIYLLAAVFCLTVFLAIDRRSQSASDTLYGVFPFFACAFLLVDWVAGRSTQRSA